MPPPRLDQRRRAQQTAHDLRPDASQRHPRGIIAGDPADTSKYSLLCDPTLDHQIDAAGRIQQHDPVAGQVAWAAADRAIVNRAAAVPYANNLSLTLLSQRTDNYQYNPEWGVLLDQLWVR